MNESDTNVLLIISNDETSRIQEFTIDEFIETFCGTEKSTEHILSDEDISELSTPMLDDLLKRVNQELCKRRPLPANTILNQWKQEKRGRKLNYHFVRLQQGWFGRLTAWKSKELKDRVIVAQMSTQEEINHKYTKKELRGRLAEEMVLKLELN